MGGIILIALWVGMVILICMKLEKKMQRKKGQGQQTPIPIIQQQQQVDTINQYSPYYQRKLLFTKNEYYEFMKLVAFAKANRLEVLAKVRLLDLIEPRTEYKRSKTFLYKIQAKHVDFVVTDAKYNIVAIIELDDNSHNRPDRAQRDMFVDEVLLGVGYNVLHTRSITNEITQMIYNIAYKPAAQAQPEHSVTP